MKRFVAGETVADVKGLIHRGFVPSFLRFVTFDVHCDASYGL